MRSGAVVHCRACESKFRIKSSYVRREVQTGPRTLDENDSILRSDSVDIDPDEAPPVSIDDDGNVVGLSGLSELMRWSDNEAASEATDVSSAVQHKASHASQALPAAQKRSEKASRRRKTTPRERGKALKRKKQNQFYMAMGGTVVALIVVAVIILQLATATPADPIKTGASDPTPDQPIAADATPPANPQDLSQPDPRDTQANLGRPEPNLDIRFIAPWRPENQAQPPADSPAVLTPATPLRHEGWYVMTPPRGAADATGSSRVELGSITATPLDDTTTRLATTLNNNAEQTVQQGELHVMLLDSLGNVFAETYAPLAMIRPLDKQPYALTVPTRYWQRARATRAAIIVQTWADPKPTLQNVQIQPTHLGQASALRLTAKHLTEKTLRNISILINATDDQGNALATFHLNEQNLYIPQNHWLDLVIATPLPDNTLTPNWSATITPQ